MLKGCGMFGQAMIEGLGIMLTRMTAPMPAPPMMEMAPQPGAPSGAKRFWACMRQLSMTQTARSGSGKVLLLTSARIVDLVSKHMQVP